MLRCRGKSPFLLRYLPPTKVGAKQSGESANLDDEMRSLILVILLMGCLGFAQAQETPPAPAGPPSQAVPSTSSAVVTTPTDPKERMELAEKVNGLHGLDIPWHMKASYEVLGLDGKSTDTGTFEEWRVNAKQYRVALHSPTVSAEEYGTDHGVFRTGDQGWPGRPLSLIRRMIMRPVPPPEQPDKIVLQNYERSFGKQKLPCTALINRDAKQTMEDAASYCFASKNAVLFYSGSSSKMLQTLFEHISIVHGQYFANNMQLFIGGRPWLKLHVDTLEGLGPEGLSALTVPPDASPVAARIDVAAETTPGHLITKAFPVYPAVAKQQGVQGTVILTGVIGTDGHFKKIDVLTGPPMLQQAAVDSVRQWVYTPYLREGKPVEVETDISVVFALQR
jgi:TonB family protein